MAKDVLVGDSFRVWTERIQQSVQDLMIFNPMPTISVSHEGVLKKHAREAICVQHDRAEFSFTSVCGQVSSNPDPNSVRDEDVVVDHFIGHHFTSGGSVGSASTAIPRFSTDPHTSCCPLDTLMDYFSRCNLGLPNSASCSQVF